MDLVVKSRGGRVSGLARQRIERKAAKLERLEGRIQRIEVEVIKEPTPRVNGGHRVEASARTARRTFRASAAGSDVDTAVERVLSRLGRQVTEEHKRRRTRMIDGANRVKSDDRRTEVPEE
ncbi:MAG TPA: ribosome-associated translation inhibitor RaiA [Actinomycetota bacterium]|jgi:ribosomal subunit interface protein|nr:ribosome-associated translation inhibitor RaiA [Actinomycetota bacterium]